MAAPIVGGVYYVADEKIVLLPPEERKMHEARRMVLVVSGVVTNSDNEWRVALCCPISGSSTMKTPYCVPLAYGEGNVNKKCWVRVPAIQPIMKRDIEDLSGIIPAAKLEQVYLRLVQYMGLG